MELVDLITQMEELEQNGAYDVEMWLTCMCNCASLEDFATPMQVKSEDEWNLFRTLLKRLLKVIGQTEDGVKARIEELRELIALEDRYQYRDPDYSQKLEEYCKKAADQAVQIQSEVDRYRIAALEQSEILLNEEVAAKDKTITQLQKLLEKAPQEPAPVDDGQAQLCEQLRQKNQSLEEENGKLQAEIRKLRNEAASRPAPAAPEPPPIQSWSCETELHIEPSPEPEPSDDPLVYYLDKHNVLSGAGMTPTALHQLPHNLCAQVEILKIMEGNGTWGVVGDRLRHFPNLIALVLGHSVNVLERDALHHCPNLKIIRFDNPNCSIDELPNRLQGVSIVALPGGYVEKYAQEHGLGFTPPRE